MTESYLHLASSGSFQADRDAYWQMATSGGDGLPWLEGRYGGVLPAHAPTGADSPMTQAMALGFWLRRGIDGSREELWAGLREVVRRFDATWYATLPSTYSSGNIEW